MLGPHLLMIASAIVSLGQLNVPDAYGNGVQLQRVIMGGGSPSDKVSAATRLLLSEEQSSCSGALVAPDVIVTAAHCLPKDRKKRIVVSRIRGLSGFVKTLKASEFVLASTFQAHPKFRVEAFPDGRHLATNDIAVVVLREAIKDQPVARLPDPQLKFEWPQDVIIAGWGVIPSEDAKAAPSHRPVHLFQADVRSMLNPDHDAHIALYGEKNTCPGDSGGPTYIVMGDSLTLVGVHTSSNGCAEGAKRASSKDVFVPLYVEWIKATARALGSRYKL